MTSDSSISRTGYLGPAGSWTHQVCLDLFGSGTGLVPLEANALFCAFVAGEVDAICVPVTASQVGATPYLDAVLQLHDTWVVATHCKALGYSLLARPGATLGGIASVLAHPVALQEVARWLDGMLPQATRLSAGSAGAAARQVAQGGSLAVAAMAPPLAGRLYGLQTLADGIEQGPHNLTRWWVLARSRPAAPFGDHVAARRLPAAGADRMAWRDFLVRHAAHQVLGAYPSTN